MAFQQTPYTAISLLSGASLLALTLYLLGRYRSRDTWAVVWSLAAITGLSGCWSLVTGFGLASAGLEGKLLWGTASFVGLLVAPTWVVFALLYTDREHWVSPVVLAVLYGPSAVVFGLVVLLGPQSVVWTSVERAFNGSFYVLLTENRPWYRFLVGYLYVLILLGMGVLYEWLYRAGGIYRGQAGALIVGSIAPTAANALLYTELLPHPSVNVTPLGFVVTSVAFTFALVRYDLLDIVPVGRASVIETMRDGYLVVDPNGRIVDANPAARDLLAGEAVIGSSVADVVPGGETITADARADDSADARTFEGVTDDGVRHVEVRPSTLTDGNGTVLMLQDVTERHRNEQRLQQRNEQLDRFASVVSHDLRNPLNVAMNRLSLATREDGSDHLAHVDSALTRMEGLIDHTLDLARSGSPVGDPEPVPLAEVVDASWNGVASADATLETEPLPTVEGDRQRIRQLFENLIRNAVEHGSTSPDSQTRRDAVEHGSTSNQNAKRSGDALEHGSTSPDSQTRRDAVEQGGPEVTIRVGTCDDGFYLEDDGPGIPDADHEQVVEYGYTTCDGGTGLGLATVSEIATAHGWQVTVTDGTAGGARFEFTGVRAIGADEAGNEQD